jgi:MSHA biogenesis protein MshJ
MKRYWELACTRIDELALRERALIFAAAGFVTISLVNSLLLDPLFATQKALSTQVIQKQEKIKELQAAIHAQLQARRDDESSPLRLRSVQLKQQLQELDAYMQSRSSRLVEPDRMPELLKQVLGKNGGVQLVALKTLPASPLIESKQAANAVVQSLASAIVSDGVKRQGAQKVIYRHGVQISVRGRYLDLLRYVRSLEELPAQMFWGEANLKVEQYPYSVLTLTLYTLSRDKTWLTV